MLPPIDSWWTWIFGALSATVATTTFLLTQGRVRARFKIIGVTVVDEPVPVHMVAGVRCPVIEVTVKNSGGRTILLSSVDVDVHRVWYPMRQEPLGFVLKPSGTYDVVIDPKRDPPYRQSTVMSQVLKEKDIDRFRVRLRLDPLEPFEQIYALTMRFIIDGRRWTKPVDLVLLMPDMSGSSNAPGYFVDTYLELRDRHGAQLPDLFTEGTAAGAIEIEAWNRRILAEAQTWPGYRNPRASDLARLAADRPVVTEIPVQGGSAPA